MRQDSSTNERVADILAVTDGRAGNVAMALGVAEAVSRKTGFTASRIDVKLPRVLNKVPPRLLASMPPRMILSLAGISFGDGASLIIGAGRRSAAIVAALRKSVDVPCIQILDSKVATDRFDLVIAPRHDRLKGANVISTEGSVHRVTPALVTSYAASWKKRIERRTGGGQPRVAVLVGGNNNRYAFEESFAEPLLNVLEALSEQGASLAITASRRTSADLSKAMHLMGQKSRFWAWDGQGENPYFGMLGWADGILATPDSINMLSEAASIGKPLLIIGGTASSKKHAAFVRGLCDSGVARIAKAPLSFDWQPRTTLAETSRVADIIIDRLL